MRRAGLARGGEAMVTIVSLWLLVGWFVMIKDAKGRFKDNPHWDAGWGWGLYYVADPKKNVSEGFNRSCKGCHIPAKLDDWVYVDGYLALSK
jgi:hypothetical protein